MSAPTPRSAPATASSSHSSLVRAAIWVAIGALIAAAIVCVVWVLVGAQNGLVGRAFLTILLLAAFAGVAILDAHLSARRPAWFALASMATWVATLLIGAVMIWLPERYAWSGFNRFVQFLLIVLILQLALLHLRLYTKAYLRHRTTFTQIVATVTIVLVIVLTIMLVIPLIIGEWVRFADLYWRFVVAVTILVAVGTALIPLVNALFAPRRPLLAGAEMTASALPPWPTFADGVTPLPVMPDGSPDWNAYYTGYPSTVPQAIAPVIPFAAPTQQWPAAGPLAPPAGPPASSVAPGYEGYPPPPPLPPRP